MLSDDEGNFTANQGLEQKLGLDTIRKRLRDGFWQEYQQRSCQHRFFLQWWEWGEVIGAVGLVILIILWRLDQIPHPAVVAVVLHIATDFTFQSEETVVRKRKHNRSLLVHGLIAGGLPLAVAGLVVGKPFAVIVWMAIGAASHYVIDGSNRFGLQHLALGVILDQTCHLLLILLLVLFL